MYTLCKYADETELVISDIIINNAGEETIRVIFERPKDYGFDTLIFELPSCKIIKNVGRYTDKEIALFKTVVERGSTDFYKIAKEGEF